MSPLKKEDNIRKVRWKAWSTKQRILINEVKKNYSYAGSKGADVFSLFAKQQKICDWKIISQKTSIPRHTCSTMWCKIKNRYAKLLLLLQSGKLTLSEIKSDPNVNMYFDGSLTFLDPYCKTFTETDLPPSVNKWGSNLVLHLKNKHGSKVKGIISHFDIIEMLIERQKENNNELDIEDDDIHYLQKTIKKLINYKLNKVINNQSNTVDKKIKLLQCKVKDAVNEDTSSNKIIEVESTINKDDSWDDENISLQDLKKVIQMKLHGGSMMRGNSKEENIKNATINKSLEHEHIINENGTYEENTALSNLKNVMNLHSEVILKDEFEVESIKENTVMEINDDTCKKNRSLEIMNKNINLHSEVMLIDDFKEEIVENDTECDTMVAESTIDDVWDEKTFLEYKKKAMKLLHSEVMLEDDIKEESKNSRDERMEVESTISEDEACEEHITLENAVQTNRKELENIEEMSDDKVKKFFKDLGATMSLLLPLEKQEELKSRITNIVIESYNFCIHLGVFSILIPVPTLPSKAANIVENAVKKLPM
ncbi:hypothetical protein HF086_015627 [Spodoptera exigua]|uniref:Uncharacterized protein n=1 Tax=Spodoptera exigua TaxID=7107 RepID=A0A922MQE6_SPOEX|nr:hypothetical protein HF086_015627 [Spodoptera exigua]